jgi:hypothetical protein
MCWEDPLRDRKTNSEIPDEQLKRTKKEEKITNGFKNPSSAVLNNHPWVVIQFIEKIRIKAVGDYFLADGPFEV